MSQVESQTKLVSKKNRNQLRSQAYMLRKKFEMEHLKLFPIMDFLELIMPQVDPQFQVVPVEDSELCGRAAETIPSLHVIKVKQSIYDAACAGNAWARLVMAHELGHYMCHGDEVPSYAHPAPGEKIPDEINPERQADIFAAELLAPVHLITESSDYLVSKHYGVPRSVARVQMNQVKKIRRRHSKKKLLREKKNG